MHFFHGSINSKLEMLIGDDFLSVRPLYGIVGAFFLKNP